MASCLWMCPCLLTLIFSFAAAEELKENVGCTFTNGKNCSNLLNENNTEEYTIEKEEINRTGVKIVFDTERRVGFIRIKSGEKLENRIHIVNITRGSLNHLVNLSCTKENQVNKITLEPVVVSKDLQIDFVKGCGSDIDPVIIMNIQYAFGIDEEGLFQNTSESETYVKREEILTTGVFISAALNDTDLLSTSTVPKLKTDKTVVSDLEGSTVKPSSRPQTKGTKPTSPFTKKRLVATGKPITTAKKEEVKKKPDTKKIIFKVDASKSSAEKVVQDLASVCLALFVFYHV